MKIPFTKMHGCGNDYIYVNAMEHPIADPRACAIAWSDRHKGIGSDGLVLIDRCTVPEADYSMRIFNADGSEALNADEQRQAAVPAQDLQGYSLKPEA